MAENGKRNPTLAPTETTVKQVTSHRLLTPAKAVQK
jgi:hypothetical protein